MPHADGIIYVDTSTTPHKGVSVADVDAVLERNVGDVGLLCSDMEWYTPLAPDTLEPLDPALRDADKINKWNKCKPIRLDSLATPTDAQKKEVNYGLVINKYTSISEITSASGNWSYRKPRGMNGGGTGMHEWYRLMDFDGYNHNARCFVNSADIPTEYVKGFGSMQVRVNMTPESQLPVGSIAVSDLSTLNGDPIDFGDMYLAVLIRKGTDYHYQTSSSKLSANAYVAEIMLDTSSTLDSWTTGSCTIYLFAVVTQCTTVQTSQGNINTQLSAGAVMLPNVTAKSMDILANRANMTFYKLDVQLLSGGRGVKVNAIDIRSNATQSTPVSNVNVKLYMDINGVETQIGQAGGYPGNNGQGGTQTNWTIPAYLTTYHSQFGVYYQSGIQMLITPGTYIKAVLSYQVGTSVRTDEMTATLTAPDPNDE